MPPLTAALPPAIAAPTWMRELVAIAVGAPVSAKVLLKVVAWATVKVPLTVVSTPVLAMVTPVALVRPTLKAPAAAVSMVPVNKLPAVPLPEMLKLLVAC